MPLTTLSLGICNHDPLHSREEDHPCRLSTLPVLLPTRRDKEVISGAYHRSAHSSTKCCEGNYSCSLSSYRQRGLSGFLPSTAHPEANERPQEIDDDHLHQRNQELVTLIRRPCKGILYRRSIFLPKTFPLLQREETKCRSFLPSY